MNTLYMKIHTFEESSYSLIVSFASDTTESQNPDDYTKYAFQPMNMWPDVTDPTEIKKRIAVAGVYHAEQQEREEKFIADPAKVQAYKDMVGQENSYSLNSLIPPAAESTTPEIPTQTV
jgi:hypothetical protein